MRNILPAAANHSRSLVVAVVLGTALSGGTTRAAGVAHSRSPSISERTEPTPEAIQAITRYCQACWRNARVPADRWPDCTQQVFARLLERLDPAKWNGLLKDDGDDRREFVRAINAVKKQSLRTKTFAELSLDAADYRNAGDTGRQERWDAVHTAARDVLSVRQQRIVQLSAHGWDVPEIAAELATTPERISDEKYKAIRKLRGKLGIEG